MNTQIIPFENHQVQVAEAEINGNVQRVITLRDFCRAIGSDYKATYNLIQRNKDFFENFVGRVITTTPGGKQMSVALTRDAVTGLLLKVSANRVSPDRKDMIIKFQRWAVETLREVLDGTRQDVYIQRLRLEIEKIRLEGETQIRAGVLQLVTKFGDKLSATELIPLVSGVLGRDIAVDRTYSSTEVAEMLSFETGQKISAIKVGKIAKELGLRVDEGENEYSLVTITKAAHSEKVVSQIKYKKSAVNLIRERLIEGSSH